MRIKKLIPFTFVFISLKSISSPYSGDNLSLYDDGYGLNGRSSSVSRSIADEWDDPDIDSNHPPFIYYSVDNLDTNNKFKSTLFLDKEGGEQFTGFFINTNRNDGQVCVISSGHTVNDEEHDVSNVSLRFNVGLHYARTYADNNIKFRLFYSPGVDFKVIRSINNHNGVDISLMLIPFSGFPVGNYQYTELGYKFLENNVEYNNFSLSTHHHANGWPQNKTTYRPGIEVLPLNYVIDLDSGDAPVSHGSSGSGLVSDDNFAIATLTSGTPSEDIYVSLAALKNEITQECLSHEGDPARTFINPKRTVFVASKSSPDEVKMNGISAPGDVLSVSDTLNSVFYTIYGNNKDTGFITGVANESELVDEVSNYMSNPLSIGLSLYIYEVILNDDFYSLYASSLLYNKGGLPIGNVAVNGAFKSKIYINSKKINNHDISSYIAVSNNRGSVIVSEKVNNRLYNPSKKRDYKFDSAYIEPGYNDSSNKLIWRSPNYSYDERILIVPDLLNDKKQLSAVIFNHIF
ncbi:hypothetical protein [Citrobacter meridianamericanus]|uniref:Uncharacterized protein n=1 Tax=Citrobacter meridianamericanus TaxID=2894201 RepID=A0ABT1BFU7_9ENTR|nr:hypothetical protein [Citrobacter meridianamericanus]MCO5784535.1 hypothetical protein [Citrobacter meridianamericanus]